MNRRKILALWCGIFLIGLLLVFFSAHADEKNSESDAESRALYIWNSLYEAIPNEYGVAALMGNLYAESALRPNNLENYWEGELRFTDQTYTEAVDSGEYELFVDDEAGYGLAQWTYWSRKAGLLNLAREKKVSIADLDMQIEYLIYELNKYYANGKTIASQLKNATNIREASNLVLVDFENPADQSLSMKTRRASFGIDFYNQFSSQGPYDIELDKATLEADIKQAAREKAEAENQDDSNENTDTFENGEHESNQADDNATQELETPIVPVLEYQGINYSLVYDFDYYINRYEDVFSQYRRDPEGAIEHFVTIGMKEGRQGIESFDIDVYSRYSDLKRAFGNDWSSYYHHYMTYGFMEGRLSIEPVFTEYPTVYDGMDYSLVYDYNFYVGKYPDLKRAFWSNPSAALKHFVECGMREGRQAAEGFIVQSYRARYLDLRKAFGSDLPSYYRHYIEFGYKEKRKTTGTVTINHPVTLYDGIDYSLVYNYHYYLRQYADLRRAFEGDDVAALDHFVHFGMKEGRLATESFNVKTYRKRYIDLQNVFGDDLKAYYLHFIEYGYSEKRKGN